jgi:cell division protein FtsL
MDSFTQKVTTQATSMWTVLSNNWATVLAHVLIVALITVVAVTIPRLYTDVEDLRTDVDNMKSQVKTLNDEISNQTNLITELDQRATRVSVPAQEKIGDVSGLALHDMQENSDDFYFPGGHYKVLRSIEADASFLERPSESVDAFDNEVTNEFEVTLADGSKVTDSDIHFGKAGLVIKYKTADAHYKDGDSSGFLENSFVVKVHDTDLTYPVNVKDENGATISVDRPFAKPMALVKGRNLSSTYDWVQRINVSEKLTYGTLSQSIKDELEDKVFRNYSFDVDGEEFHIPDNAVCHIIEYPYVKGTVNSDISAVGNSTKVGISHDPVMAMEKILVVLSVAASETHDQSVVNFRPEINNDSVELFVNTSTASEDGSSFVYDTAYASCQPTFGAYLNEKPLYFDVKS